MQLSERPPTMLARPPDPSDEHVSAHSTSAQTLAEASTNTIAPSNTVASDASAPRLSLNLDEQTIVNPLSTASHPIAGRRVSAHHVAASPTSRKPPPSPLRRASSNMDRYGGAQSPGLRKKSSTSSLRTEEPPGTPSRAGSRRSSAYMPSSSPVTNSANLPPPIEEKPPVTAASIASEYFQKELLQHDQGERGPDADTIVILHDSCYGHRFSRPKTTKTNLSLIVERPERILAGALGVSAAYVRIGERHEGGRNPVQPNQATVSHVPFRIRRTARFVDITSPVVTNVHGTRWMEELKTMCGSAAEKLASTGKELTRPEGQSVPGQPPKEKLHEGDLYLCPESLDAFQGALGGVLDGVDAIFNGSKSGNGPSRAFVCIRPPGHHCSADYPSGFCWINNVHVGIQHAAMAHGLTHAAIIDFDLHHGDGSQTITWDHNTKVQKLPKNAAQSRKTAIGYFSIHDINSYPCEYGDIEKVQNASLCIENAHGQSVWNVHLQPWKTEADFWNLYETRYKVLLDKTRAFLRTHFDRLKSGVSQFPPKAAIFISAGFDASEWESQGMQRHKVNVPTEFYARVTRDIVQLAQEEGTGVQGRVLSVLEGGYSDRALTSGVLSHISGLCDGQKMRVSAEKPPTNGLAYDMSQHMANLGIKEDAQNEDEVERFHYNVAWWQEEILAELEQMANPISIVSAPKKPPRVGAPPAYYSPTQSYTAKVVDPSKIRRGPSGTIRPSSSLSSRAATPPPPEVDWATAAHELSKILIPSNRQTRSCRAEDLNEPRVKKEKPAPVAAPIESGRQLRGRKAAKPGRYAEDDSADEKADAVAAAAESDRRKTIAVLPSSTSAAPEKARRASRRLSAVSVASSIGSVGGEQPASRTANGTTAIPKSSVTSRAPSAASTASGVNVRKARTSGNTSTETSKAKPAVPKFASTNAPKAPVARAKPADAAAGAADPTDVDALTKGLKKITLRLPPQEEYEAKQKAQTAPEVKKRPVGRPPGKKAVAGKAVASKAAKAAVKVTAPSAGDDNSLASNAEPSSKLPVATQAAVASDLTPPVQLPAANNVGQAQGPAAHAATSPFVPAVGMDHQPEPIVASQLSTPAGPVMPADPIPSDISIPEAQISPGAQFVHYQPETADYQPALSTGVPHVNQSHDASTVTGLEQPKLQWMQINSDITSSPVESRPSNGAAEILGTPESGTEAQGVGRAQQHPLPTFTPDGVIPFGSAVKPNERSAAADGPPPS